MTDEECRAVAYGLLVLNHADLGGEWRGWRLRGAKLIGPNGGRVSERKLMTMMMLMEMREPRKNRQRKPKQERLRLKN